MNTRICVLLIGAILASGCVATRTQQSPGENVDDRLITGRVKAALIEDPDTTARKIDVATFRGVVQLNGFVDSTAERTKAVAVARKTSGVKEVRDNLQIAAGKTTVGEVIDDSVLTTRVKAALVGDRVLTGMQVNVDTKDGVVLLSGFVNDKTQQEKAGEIARGIAGVHSVKNQTELKQKAN